MGESLYCQMPHRAVLRLSGNQAQDFLQGLISNDITKASTTQAIYAVLLTPQGRFTFDFFILKNGDDFLLDCEKEKIDALIAKLNVYKLRADITLTKESFDVYFIWDRALCSHFDFCFEDTRAANFGFRGYTTSALASKELDPVSIEVYHAERIKRGVAEAGIELTPERLALECNLDALGALDFHKGCYIGQEVTSRMKRLAEGGRKRLVLVQGQAPLQKGEIKSKTTKIGDIVSVSGNVGLALIRLDRLEGGALEDKKLKIKLLV
jgi:folate-binding protein YgfZ